MQSAGLAGRLETQERGDSVARVQKHSGGRIPSFLRGPMLFF